jgi:hypothetical protein
MAFIVGGAVAAGAVLREQHTVNGDASSEGITSEQMAHFTRWVRDYDHAELRYLRDTQDPGLGPTSDAFVVMTMEYRLTCRALADAITTPNTALEKMAPRLARMNERSAPGSNSASFIATAVRQYEQGDTATVDMLLARDCADPIRYGRVNGK